MIDRRTFLGAAIGFAASQPMRADELTVSIALSSDQSRVIATVLGDGDVGVENGFSLSSMPAPSDGSGSVTIDLGPATPGVYSVLFSRGNDSYAPLIAIDPGQALTIIDGTGKTVNLPSAPPDLVTRFWNNFTKARLDSVLGASLQQWILANATGGPVLIVIGIISGPLSLAFMTGALAKMGDLFAIIVDAVANSEKADGIISDDEVAVVKAAVGVVDLITQLPAILTEKDKITKFAAKVAAGNNLLASFTSENDSVALGVSLASDTTGKYMLALNALQKLP